MDSVMEQEFDNLLGERILLKIENSHVKSQRISLRRTNISVWWFLKRYLLVFFIVFFLIRFLLPNTALSLLLTFLSTLIITFIFNLLPVIEESLSLLNNLNGFEHEIHTLFRGRKRRFIPTKRLVINEGITMQRCIFYLVAIPGPMQSYVLSETDSSPSSIASFFHSTTSKSTDIRSQSTIPLFLHVLPRLDCLQVIYKQLNKSL